MLETMLISGIISQYVIPALGVIITGLVGWGVRTLQKKTNSDLAKNALDEVDRIVGTVVGGLAQTTAKTLRALAKDGHLSPQEKVTLKNRAYTLTKALMSDELSRVAGQAVESLDAYIDNKIEERVLAGKVLPVMPQYHLVPMAIKEPATKKKAEITLPHKKKAKK